ncbi:unnamed protein product [Penicillium bialowiezense]
MIKQTPWDNLNTFSACHDAALPAGEVSNVEEFLDLKFGGCKLQVQAPVKSTYTKPEQLVGRTVVTSFTAMCKSNCLREGCPSNYQNKPQRKLEKIAYVQHRVCIVVRHLNSSQQQINSDVEFERNIADCISRGSIVGLWSALDDVEVCLVQRGNNASY